MAQQNMATFDAMLQTVYRGKMVRQFNEGAYILDMIERTDANEMGAWVGDRLVFAIHAGRNRGRGAGALDGGVLATAGKQDTRDGIVTLKDFNYGIELSHRVIKLSEKNEGAFVSALDLETDGASHDMRRDVNRMVYGTGDGLLATCLDTRSARTISVDSGQYIAIGDPVDVLTKATGASKGQTVVTGVAYTGTAYSSTQANADITLAASVSVTNADGIYIAGNRNNESDGLRNIVERRRTLHAIDSSVAGNGFWDGTVVAAGWVTPDEDLFMRQAQQARQRSGEDLDVYVTTYGVQRGLANTYTSQKRLTDARGVEIPGGYSAIMVSAGGKPVPVVADVDAPNGEAIGIRKDTFCWSELDKPDWLRNPDNNGSRFFLKTAGTGQYAAAWQAWFTWQATLICVKPRANTRITQFKDDIPIDRE